MSMPVSRLRLAFVSAAVATMIGCAAEERKPDPAADAAAAAAPAGEERRVVLFVGTSLTAAYGLDPEEGYPARVQEKIDSAGLPFEVVNAGVSGETAAGARRRVEWLLRQPFQVLVLETGANDMLRGSDLDSTRADIQAIVDRVKAERPQARVVLAGMMAPPNLGPRYAEGFREMYPQIARSNGLPIIPFLLEGVAGQPELNLPDGIHPNARGQRRVAANVWRTLEPVLRAEAARPYDSGAAAAPRP